jgi:ribosome-associated translation inhibitor RaiA
LLQGVRSVSSGVDANPHEIHPDISTEEVTMTVEIEGLTGRLALRALIGRKIAAVFEPRRAKPTIVRVLFVDENGPKGGVGIKCGITVEVPRRPAFHAEDRGETHRLAFDGAFDALERQVVSGRERRRAESRRPRKYFLAKRLLMSEEGVPGLEEARQRRRGALRRPA